MKRATLRRRQLALSPGVKPFQSLHSARPPSAPPITYTSHECPSPVQTSQHNHDSQGVTYSGRFATQLQNQPLQPPPSAVAVGARAASVSTTQTRRTMVQRVWSVGRPSIIQSQFYQTPPAAQQQPSTKSRSLHAGPTSAAHDLGFSFSALHFQPQAMPE